MSAPTDDSAEPPAEDEAIERIQGLLKDGQELLDVIYTGGHTDYAHIYLAAVHGHNQQGDEMLLLNYCWLSKPDAYENDMWGDNGISIRLVDGLGRAMQSQMIHAVASLDGSGPDEIQYRDLRREDDD